MELFSMRHLVWLGATVGFVTACMQMGRLALTSCWHTMFRVSVFTLVLVNESAWFCYRHFVAGIPIIENLPLHLCDISVFVMFAALVTDNRRLAELSYFPGVAGALLAVCLPAISESG